MNAAVRALLTGAVDYAGLFPPAALAMPDAVANHAAYLRSGDAWALGRFVLPVGRLGEFAEARAALGEDGSRDAWRLSVLVDADVAGGVARIEEFMRAHPGLAVVDSIEAKLADAPAIVAAGAAVSYGTELFVEIPITQDPAPLVAATGEAGASAKVRTGGVTAEAFPRADHLARFLARCVAMHVPFKATAGLHHPIRAAYRLTYDADAPTAPMYGYLNVLLAAAFLRVGASEADAAAILQELSPAAFQLDDHGATWRGFRLAVDDLRQAREVAARSFGSCSFREPLDDLVPLGLA